MIRAPGLRERKKLQTRHNLEEAALRLFARQGFDATTVEDIAAEVEVSPRTFFRYFASKEAVLLTDDEALRDGLLAALRDRPSDEPILSAIHGAVRIVAARYEEIRNRLFLVYRLMTETPSLESHSLGLQAAWVSALAAEVGRRLGQDPGELAPRLVARAALSCLHSAAEVWFATQGRAHLPDLVDQAFATLSTGLAELPAPRARPGVRPRPSGERR